MSEDTGEGRTQDREEIDDCLDPETARIFEESYERNKAAMERLAEL